MNITDVLAGRAFARLSGVNAQDFFEADKNGEEIKGFLEDTYKLLQTKEYYSEGLRNLCHACENVPKDPFLVELLKQCIGSSRVFLYEEMLRERGVEFQEENGLFEVSQRSFYSLDSEILLTKEQKDLYDTFKEKRRLVVSAPTSFGKSRIVREIISHNSYESVMMVVPTNALLSETYFAFKQDENLKRYNLIYSTHSEPSSEPTIYIFTPEKFDVYTDEHQVSFDFFIFDEVYKVDSSDNRSSVFASCLYKAYKERCDYYLIGPYFKSFSKEFLRRTKGHFEKYNTDIVQKKVINYLSDKSVSIDGAELKSLKGKEPRLMQILQSVSGQSIVYVGRKDSAETRAHYIAGKRSEDVKSEVLDELIEYIKRHISEEWRLLSCLSKGVAFHHAGVPKYIQSEIVDLFNAGVLDVIVCTPTLTEGVNTSAKNVIFYDTTKADIELSGFDVKNIVGRSGRFGHHFVGRAIFLEEHVAVDEIDEIRFPIFDYDFISPEDNIQISLEDLNGNGQLQRDVIMERIFSERVPLDLLKKNKYIPFEKQISLIQYLRRERYIGRSLGGLHSLPDKEQMSLIMELVHDQLFADTDKKESWTTARLSKFVKFQIYHKPSLKVMIAEYNAVKEDTKIRNVLELIYRYFEFSLPKYLMAFERIFNFVYGGKMSLALTITHLQYGSDKIQDILLVDAGVPRSIVNRISDSLSGVKDVNDIRKRFDQDPRILSDLSGIEMRMLAKRI
ncbi:DEAD/DEAH box helicase [Pseudomonas sp. JV414]|uniref:helicase-related protein n=1 Tax=Pseudomonas sp. JV414 TaxID=1733110 RepID=UPI0028E13ABA|nr:helicase-related protein [Pseudomonas sp. JV414]MDT9677718.1 DEAD/DEAH box helicase [Pseudomonas sp. JV414]